MNHKNTASKALLTSLLSFLLCSCQSDKVNCYQCYFGNMYLSDASTSYDQIQMIENTTRCSQQFEETFYSDVFIIKTREELETLYQDEDYYFPEDDEGKTRFKPNENIIVYFFVQIPKGYLAYKRDNVQDYLNGRDGITLLTDNFYYYTSRKDMLYCVVDLKKGDSKENSVFSFFFEIPFVYRSILDVNHLNIILSDAEATSK